MLKFECSLAKFGLDTADNEPSKVSSSIPSWAISFHIAIPPWKAWSGGHFSGPGGRVLVALNEGDPSSAWKRIKPENLRRIEEGLAATSSAS